MKNQHLVPQMVIDCAENMARASSENSKMAYVMRLEAIRDYCDVALKKQSQFKLTIPTKKKNSSR